MRSSVEGLTDVPEEVRLVRHRRKKLRPSAENSNSPKFARPDGINKGQAFYTRPLFAPALGFNCPHPHRGRRLLWGLRYPHHC